MFVSELEKMGRYKDETPAVRVYTVCDESRSVFDFVLVALWDQFIEILKLLFVFRYMIVRNVPALGCGDDLMRLFISYGEVEE